MCVMAQNPGEWSLNTWGDGVGGCGMFHKCGLNRREPSVCVLTDMLAPSLAEAEVSSCRSGFACLFSQFYQFLPHVL